MTFHWCWLYHSVYCVETCLICQTHAIMPNPHGDPLLKQPLMKLQPQAYDILFGKPGYVSEVCKMLLVIYVYARFSLRVSRVFVSCWLVFMLKSLIMVIADLFKFDFSGWFCLDAC